MDRNFHPRKLNAHTWMFDGDGSYCYLITGEDQALMVDTGMSKANLRAYAEKFTDKPILVVNTHGHFDHTGGNGYFDQVYLHRNGIHEARQAFGDTADYPLDYEPIPIEEGHVFHLGGIDVEAIAIPAHADSSIALLDRQNRVLYTGDECECGQVLLLPEEGDPANRVAAHLANMKKLKARESEYDIIYPAHNGSPIDKSYVDMFIELDSRVLGGVPGGRDMFSRVLPAQMCAEFQKMADKGILLRAEYQGASIIYVAENARLV